MFETVVTVDHSAVKIVQVGGGKAATGKLNHGTKIGGDNGKGLNYHPLRIDLGVGQAADHLKPFGGSQFFGLRGTVEVLFEFGGEFVQVNFFQSIEESFRTHAGFEPIGQPILFQFGKFGVRNQRVGLNSFDKGAQFAIDFFGKSKLDHHLFA
ncbi:MAG: hypothetical protein ACD_61C00176G0002 [uncultured bacterium]|nr:MAG: hypothetical protein ACD_61C00176G0002 [uncultured bacterium]